MTRLRLGVAAASLGGSLILGGLFTAISAQATGLSLSPWAYACGSTAFGNPATKLDTPDSNGCPATDTAGSASADYHGGVLTLVKSGLTSDDLAAGATVSGFIHLTSASWDAGTESYCGAGAPRLNVTTSDGKTHFYGCAAHNTGGHISITFATAASDGSGNGGFTPDDTVTAIDFVQDESGTAILTNIAFVGIAPTATPAATSAATPTATPHPVAVTGLAPTGGGSESTATSALFALGMVLIGIGFLTYWRRKAR